MQAFKASNPGSIFEDFIRWYSPNDWSPVPYSDDTNNLPANSKIPPDNKYGYLSVRMSDKANIWQQLWIVFITLIIFLNYQKAQPITAANQTPLFDIEKEAELALNYLETISCGNLMQQLATVSATNALNILASSGSYLF